jgi:signal transduction histidine kinase
VSEELGRLAQRLRELADQLRDPSLDDERVEALAREAADLAAQAGTEAEAVLRDTAGEADE